MRAPCGVAARLAGIGASVLGLAIVGLGWDVSGWAQNAPIQTTQLPPLQEQSRPGGFPSVPPPPALPGGPGVPGPNIFRPGSQGSAVPNQLPPGPAVQGQLAPGQRVPGQSAQGQNAPGQLAPGQYAPGQLPSGQLPPGSGILGQGVAGSPPAGVAPAAPGSPVPGPALPGQAAPGPDQATQAVPPPATFDRPNVWVPASVVKLQALDKVNAQASELTIKVGQSATFGSLTITAKSCVVRPPDQPVDAAAYLDVTDSHKDAPGFDGWMLQDEPALSMMQHPIYDLRVAGCT